MAHQEITGLREKDAGDSSPGKLGECPARFEQDVILGVGEFAEDRLRPCDQGTAIPLCEHN